MAGYALIEQEVEAAGRRWHLETLADRQQFHDPGGALEARGISPAVWSLFGVVWPAGLLLADTMADHPVEGKRILEAGCGLAIASMVLADRQADVTASDMHPLAGEFLERNAVRNGVRTVPFRVMDWRQQYEGVMFDMIIGSDLLYERGQPELLAEFIEGHIRAEASVVLADPGRGQSTRFNKLMQANGFNVEETFYGKARLTRYARSTRSHHGAISTT